MNFTQFYKLKQYVQYCSVFILIVAVFWLSMQTLTNLYRPLTLYFEIAKYIFTILVLFAGILPEKFILDGIRLKRVKNNMLEEETISSLHSVGLSSRVTQIIIIDDAEPNIFMLWTPFRTILLYSAPIPGLMNSLDFQASLAYFHAKWSMQSQAISTAYLLLISFHAKFFILRPISVILTSMLTMNRGYANTDIMAGRTIGNMIGYRKMLELVSREFVASKLPTYIGLISLIDIASPLGELSQKLWIGKMKGRVAEATQ